MRVRMAIAIAVLALTGGVAAFLIRSRDPPPPSSEPFDVSERLAPRDVAAARPGARTSSTTEPAPPETFVVVRVLDPETWRPFANAVVEWELTLVDGTKTTGTATADDKGVVTLKSPGRPASVAVRVGRGGQWARTNVRTGDGAPAVIDLRPEPRVELQCVGADGRPVEGVELAIAMRTRQSEGMIDHAFAKGPDAVASFAAPRLRGIEAPEFFATALTPLAERVRVPLTFDPPPAKLVRVTLPPAGTLVVRLVGPDGTPWTQTANVTITTVPVRASDLPGTWRAAKDGFVEFPGVGVGLTLEAQVYAADGPTSGGAASAPPPGRVTTTARIEGPSSAGSKREVTLCVGAPRPAVTGRFVDADGRPVADCFVTARIDVPGGEPVRTAARIEPDGRFRAEFDADLPESGATLTLVVGSPGGGPDRELLRRAWSGAGTRAVDVGDLRPDAASSPQVVTIVSGRFDAPPDVDVRSGYVFVMRRVDGKWSSSGLRAMADAEGTFVVRGVRPEGDGALLLVGGAQRAVLDAPVEFRLGDDDVRARLVPVGGFDGSVLMPAGVEALGALRVFAEGECARNGGAGDRRDPPYVEAMWNGRWFGADGLKPGTVSVVFRATGSSDALLRIDGVEIHGGETAHDARLAKIDLTRLAQTAEFRVVGEDGRPLPGAELWTRPILPPGTIGVGWWKALADSTGTVRAATFGQRVAAVAMSPGRVPAEATAGTNTTTLVLAPARPSEVSVRLAPTVELPSPPFALKVRLVWCGSADAPLASDFDRNIDPRSLAQLLTVPFGADRTARFDVPEPGRWRAFVLVERLAAQSGGARPLVPQRSTEVLITAAPQRLEIEADVDAAAFAAACRELSR